MLSCAHENARSRKTTYHAPYGIVATRDQVEVVHAATCDALERIDPPTNLLRSIAGRQD